jgi:hypothetical protein
MKWLNDLLTDHDGDFDVVSTLGAMAVVVFLCLSIYVTLHTGAFDYSAFGASVGMMLAGLGGGYFAKSSAKPTEESK